ncbi:hypothetical protein BN8_01375 [Fibrisoma limi BUZ 3]|uniref:Uncharacterized protein n=1 Tax=Fibrisoma limi BUZ 3 TaxID=1185876 RepID=I2GEQ2_9BACT|nr:hypothetical protein BN8_01375 [Fibrisoma limi BUZ 3]
MLLNDTLTIAQHTVAKSFYLNRFRGLGWESKLPED